MALAKLSKKDLKNKLHFFDKYKILTEDAIDLENKIIYLAGEMEEDLGTVLKIKYTAIKLYWEEEKNKTLDKITIDISSYGGATYALNGALDFYDETKEIDNILVDTKAQGICMSAATVLLAGGTGIRTASKRCKFMLHDVQITDVSGTATQVVKQAEDIRKEQEEFFEFYVQLSRKRGLKELEGEKLKKETKRWMDKYAANSIDHYISSKEAFELGLCDKII